MENLSDNKLWRPCDEKGTRLFTKIPNTLLKEFLSGKYTQNEIKIMLYICRMSFGMKDREETNYLSYEDISQQTGIARTHISTLINKLIDKKAVFRSVKSGSKYRFAINILRFGVQMKYYRIWNLDNGISTKEYVICSDVYGICTSEANENLVIAYNPEGYSNSKEVYRNQDRNLDRNKDKACSTNADSTATNDQIEKIKQKIYPEIENILWEKEDNENTFVMCMKKLMEAGVHPYNIWDIWHQVWHKKELETGVKWDTGIYNRTVEIFQEYEKSLKKKNSR